MRSAVLAVCFLGLFCFHRPLFQRRAKCNQVVVTKGVDKKESKKGENVFKFIPYCINGSCRTY